MAVFSMVPNLPFQATYATIFKLKCIFQIEAYYDVYLIDLIANCLFASLNLHLDQKILHLHSKMNKRI